MKNYLPLLEVDSCQKRLLNLEADPFIYHETKDPFFIKQFVELRKTEFNKDECLVKSLKPDEGIDYGLDTRLIVVRNQEDKVIGGAVIVINHSNCKELLPLESEEFRLHKIFPDFELKRNFYAAFKQFVIAPEYLKTCCAQNLFRMIYNLYIENNIRYLFGVAPLVRARRNRICFTKLNTGLVAKIYYDIPLPERSSWNGVRRYLMSVDFCASNSNVANI